tara:strand:+ start:15 stop:149 length:135 start_codon:yes stop_codon:yes gene_type:complete
VQLFRKIALISFSKEGLASQAIGSGDLSFEQEKSKLNDKQIIIM